MFGFRVASSFTSPDNGRQRRWKKKKTEQTQRQPKTRFLRGRRDENDDAEWEREKSHLIKCKLCFTRHDKNLLLQIWFPFSISTFPHLPSFIAPTSSLSLEHLHEALIDDVILIRVHSVVLLLLLFLPACCIISILHPRAAATSCVFCILYFFFCTSILMWALDDDDDDHQKIENRWILSALAHCCCSAKCFNAVSARLQPLSCHPFVRYIFYFLMAAPPSTHEREKSREMK